MNYEKTYKEAIESIKRIYEQADSFGKELMEKEFPELKESEDEKIVKNIIAFIKENYPSAKSWIVWLEKQGEHANFRNMIQVGDKVTKNEDGVLVNLSQLKRVAKPSEKHGVQKPADKVNVLMSLDEAIEHCKEKSCGNNACALEHKQLEKWLTELKELKEQKPIWSEEDEEMLKIVIKSCEQCGNEYAYYWVKSLKDRVQPQPKQEWSEEDERMLKDIISGLEATKTLVYAHDKQGKAQMQERIDWLKSIKPQTHWKPSEKQMEELARITRGNSYPHLSSLYNELKKL